MTACQEDGSKKNAELHRSGRGREEATATVVQCRFESHVLVRDSSVGFVRKMVQSGRDKVRRLSRQTGLDLLCHSCFHLLTACRFFIFVTVRIVYNNMLTMCEEDGSTWHSQRTRNWQAVTASCH